MRSPCARQQVAREQRPDLDVLILRQARPRRERRRQRGDEGVADVGLAGRPAACPGSTRRRSAAVDRQRGSWPKPGSRQRAELLAEELPRHRPLRHRRSGQVWIEPVEQQRPPRRVRLACPEAADLRLAEQVVAGEHLVGALAGQHDLDAGVLDQLRQQEQRRRRGAQDRPLGVCRITSGNARAMSRASTPAPRDGRCRDARPSDAGSRSRRTRRPSKRSENVEKRAALGAQAERRDERAVESAGEVAADRHVGAQHAQAGRLLAGPRARRRPRPRASRGSPPCPSLGVGRRPRPRGADRAVGDRSAPRRARSRRRPANTVRGGTGPQKDRIWSRPDRIEGARDRGGSAAKMAFTSLAK